jgi:hypothetical protein
MALFLDRSPSYLGTSPERAVAMETVFCFPLKATTMTTMQERHWPLAVLEQLWVLLPCITMTEIVITTPPLRRDTAPIDGAYRASLCPMEHMRETGLTPRYLANQQILQLCRPLTLQGTIAASRKKLS